MQVINIDDSNIAEFRPLIKDEIFNAMRKRNTFASGVIFLGGPQGIAVWQEEEELATLKYIYVTEECRHMEIGTALIRHMSKVLFSKGIPELLCEYSAQDNRKSLTGFFESFGAIIDEFSYPYGSVTFDRLLKGKKEFEVDRITNKAVPFNELLPTEKGVVVETVKQETGEDIPEYMICPLSMAVIHKDEVKAFTLARQEAEVFHLDYFYSQGGVKDFAAILSRMWEEIEKLDTESGVLDMILYNEQSKKLYEHFSSDIASVSLVHASVDTRMVAEDAMIEEVMES